MGQLVWKNGKDMGIALDDETQSITIFSGNTSILLDGETGKIITQGLIAENNGGERTEDLMLKKTASVDALIPSTTITPIPQATVNLPFTFVAKVGSDINTMIMTFAKGVAGGIF